MAFLVLFSTSAFAVSMHYCGKNLVDYSLSQKAASCGMETAQVQKEVNSNHYSFQKKGCCTNKKITKQQDEVNSNPQLQLEQQVFVATFFYTYTLLFKEEKTQKVPHQNYTPPLLVYDLLLLDNTFLI
ncbi:hypothetical protein SAMN04488096_106233 [Mesonia phycicola]|uniref:Uncharacterized protein n=1 Tax=Mesonia phycicola TaxID=579105 RepID=A0A1M6FNB2_9FLAO|nr:hypothetical protein [Mesonia phycicola]SHI99164.1 hypothetical protein SAMN04488096_106233 [Mesonia phycicola]